MADPTAADGEDAGDADERAAREGDPSPVEGADEPTGEAGADRTGEEQTDDSDEGPSADELRRAVEERYDFENFGPAEMARMSPEEWSAAFDPDAWITGEELLDRVEADLRARVADRDVFAVVERTAEAEPRLVAYSDASYAVVHPDGSVEGEGAVLEDVKPSVALASMPDYDVPEPPADGALPAPAAVEVGTSGVGNLVLQVLAVALAVAAVALFGAVFAADLGGATIVAVVVALVFLLVAVALLVTVANARLSARYRAEEYRDRLRGAGVDGDDRPSFLPVPDAAFEEPAGEADGEGRPPAGEA